jgi:hypothetical protein
MFYVPQRLKELNFSTSTDYIIALFKRSNIFVYPYGK